MSNIRYCQVKGHQENNTTYLCTYKHCKLDSKWVCVDCIVLQIHSHGQSTQFLMQRLEEDLAAMQKNYFLEEIEEIMVITNNNYSMLEYEQIEKIINANNYSNKHNIYHKKYQNKQQNSVKKFQSYQKTIQRNKIYKQIQKIIKYSNLMSHQFIKDIQKYLVFGGHDRKIQVYDILTKQIIKSIKIDNILHICRFTKDSKYLICDDSEGQLFCFDTNKDFNQTFKIQIHSGWIFDILPIDHDQIVTYHYIITLDYDQQNDIIISGSFDQSIKFFNKTTGLLKFEKKRLMIMHSGLLNLILCQIDYHNKQLIRIKVLEQEHYSFTSVSDNNRIILICNKKIQILIQNFSVVQSINHDLYFYDYQKTKQINSMNYIIVQSFLNFQVLKKV